MWTGFDVLLGLFFMAAWAIAVVAGTGLLIAAYCLLLGKRTSA